MNSKTIPADQQEELLSLLKTRFDKNKNRHKDLSWPDIEAKLRASPEKLWSLNEMEYTGGEPDVLEFDEASNTYIFYDCAPESPKGRRSLCFDDEALEARKEHKPQGSAIGMAVDMGVEILDETQYRKLQEFGSFDTKTSSWIATPNDIRELDGALFCDRRYNTVFLYHNGSQSYYAARGFRALLRV